jgi:hypothetical protein
MSKNEVNLHLIPGGQSEIEIHVTYEHDESIEAYLFSSGHTSFAQVFVRWLRERTNEPVADLQFNLSGVQSEQSPLVSELRNSGATVRLVG